MYIAKLTRAGLVLAGIVGCCGASAQQNTDNQIKEVQLGSNLFALAAPIPSWVDPSPLPEASKPQALVARLVDTQYLVGTNPANYVRRATLVNDAASLTAAGRVSISFAPEYENVQLHAIHIYRGQERLDRTTSSGIRFLQREQGLEQGVYSGRVTASILVDDLRVGDTIDISYTLYGRNPVFGGKYFAVSTWDQNLPTLRRRVVLNYPFERPIIWRMVGYRASPPPVSSSTIRDGIRRIEFDQQPLQETVGEAQAPSDFFGLRFLQFSEYANWNEVALWANTLFDTKALLGDELQRVVTRIQTLGSDEAKITAALEFVQSEIRYFSVSLGESSHRPASPDEVLRRRYGDCKDKSFLLITLLHELGIESRPVLLQIGRRAGLEQTLPSPQFFNHAIVQVSLGGKIYFLDPTRLGQHGLLDRMGQAHDGAQVLVVAPETEDLSTISTDNADSVRDELVERATLSKFDSEGQLTVQRTWNGVTAESIRLAYERTSRDRILKGIGDAMERRYPGAKLVGEPMINDDRIRNIFSVTASYSVPKLATERDGGWVVSFRPENMQDVLITSPSATRTTPLRIPRFPYHGKYSFEMIFPEQVSVMNDPHAQTVGNKYLSASVSDYFRGNVAKKTIELTTLRSSVEAENYPAFAEDLRSLNKAIGGAFIVNKLAVKSSDASAKIDFPQRIRDLREDVIKKTTEAIAGGKLGGADLAEVYCLRGGALADLGRIDEALQDTSEAVRLAPNSTVPLGCRGDAYFHAGLFDKSIADYSRVISLGTIEAWAFRGRGISKLYAGRLDEASADFTKADEIATDSENRINSDIWLTSTYAQLGKAVPDSVAKRAAEQRHGDWPRPALAMLTGAISPEDFLKSIDEKKGDERQMALSEGYFYLGEHFLGAGERDTARTYFERSREMGVIIYTEHVAAGYELQRLMNGNVVPLVAVDR